MKKTTQRLKNATLATLKSLRMIAPMLLAVIGLVGLFETYITPEMIHTLFNGKVIHDTLIGTAAGSISVGQPFLSYIIGGELLKDGISSYAVTAFILSFVTLGVIQLPLEFSIFGARFTLIRNLLSLVFAVIISWATAYTLELLNGYFS
ncbi:permease [Sulfurovum sp.]|uniref:permease n=1 Tax=Sulfurovum sp. TaxID=1969726 RepID=UPI0025E6F561|nr:permease [Sulfurovum sp.]